MIKINISKDVYTEDYLIINNLLGQDGYDYNKASDDIINDIEDYLDEATLTDELLNEYIDYKIEQISVYYHDVYNLNHSINVNGNYYDVIDEVLEELKNEDLTWYKLLNYINGRVITDVLYKLILIEDEEEGNK